MVQFLLILAGVSGSSKAKGPAFGSMSGSTAVMLIALGCSVSQVVASFGFTWGALSLMSSRYICSVPVPLIGGIPSRKENGIEPVSNCKVT